MNNRRNILTGLGTVASVAIAGCSGSSGNNGNSNNRSSDETDASSGSEETETSSGSDETDTSSGSDETDASLTPETVTRRFWEAIINEDYEAANELLHPGSLSYPLGESDLSVPNAEIRSIEEVSYTEASDRITLASEEEFDKAIEERTGVSGYTLVYVGLSEAETVTPVVEDDGELLTVYLR